MKKYIYLFILCFISLFLVSCKNNSDNNQNDDPIFVKTYLIIFDGNGGTLVKGSENQSVEDPSQIVAPTYEKEGYEFDGWSVDLTSINTDKMVYAKWKEIVVVRTVTFDANGGFFSGIEKEEVSNKQLLTEPSEPIKEGYTFEGWFNGEVKWIFKSDIVTKDLTLKAHYKINQYNITLKYNDGVTEDKVITQDYGTAITLEATTRVGYTFDGWSEVIETMPAENKTIEANWKINQYSITLKYNDGIRNDEVITRDYNTPILIDNPTRVGYTFDKWSEAIPETMPAENKIIEASWKINEYLLTVKYNDGVTKDKVIRLDYNEKIIVETPSKFGYTFDKWSESVPERMPDRNVTLEAVWKINQYTLTVQFKDGVTEDLVLTQDYETAISIDVPSRTGYTFNSWSEVITIMPAENKTIEASWICDVKYCIENEKAIVTGFNKDNNIVVLDHYDGYETTEIGSNAFINCTTLENIVLPTTVKTIGESAFYQCSALSSIDLTNITFIGKDAFHECNKLSSISLPACLTIDNYAFSDCVSLTKVEHIDKLTTIDEGAFNGCAKLATIEFPNTLVTIGPLAFSNCVALENFSTYNSLSIIGNQAFNGCTALSTINIEVGNLTIDTLAFNGCTKLANLNFTKGTLSFGKKVFKDCISLVNISLQEGLTELSESCFEGCTSLSSVSLPNTLLNINVSAFEGCTSLSSVSLSNTLLNIGISAFKGCTSLSSVSLSNTLLNIGASAFEGCTSLSSVALPNTLLNIGVSAFDGCSSLSSIELQEGVQTIEANAFANCVLLTSFTLPNSVLQVGNDVLKGCNALTEISIPFVGSSRTEESNRYFSYLFGGESYSDNNQIIPTTLTKVTITDESLIASNAFRNCGELVEVYINGNTKIIESNAFYDCVNLTKIVLSDTIKEIKEKVFFNCRSLTNVYLSSSLETIYEYAFFNCFSLSEILLPENLLDIGSHAFTSCTSLLQLNCNKNLEIIDEYAFFNCSSLKEVNFNSNLTTIGKSAFNRDTSLTEIVVPDNVKTIGLGAFINCDALTSIRLPFVGKEMNGSTNNNFGYIFGAETYSTNSTNIPDSLKTIIIDGGNIPSRCFYGLPCSAKIVLLNNDLTIAEEGFYAASYLEKVEILGNKVTMGKNAFYECSDLVSVKVRDGLTRIEQETFRFCESLTTVNFPSTLKYIGISAFSDCTSLTTIYLKEGLTTIDKYAFNRCAKLSIVSLPDTLETINDGAFKQCSSLTSIVIPAGVTTMGHNVFESCKTLETVGIEGYSIPSTWDENWLKYCNAEVEYGY